MTFGEIEMWLTAYNERNEDDLKSYLVKTYNLTDMLSAFVCYRLNGQKIPSIYDIYPDYFEKSEEVIDKETELIKAQLCAFAISHNIQKSRKGVNQ